MLPRLRRLCPFASALPLAWVVRLLSVSLGWAASALAIVSRPFRTSLLSREGSQLRPLSPLVLSPFRRYLAEGPPGAAPPATRLLTRILPLPAASAGPPAAGSWHGATRSQGVVRCHPRPLRRPWSEPTAPLPCNNTSALPYLFWRLAQKGLHSCVACYECTW